MTSWDRGPQNRSPVGTGRPVGLATFDVRDPDATFRLVEPVPPPPPRPGAARLLVWPLRLLAAWVLNLVALATAGLVLTDVGSSDPLPYVVWAALFGLVNVLLRFLVRLRRGRLALVLSAVVLPFLVNVLLLWLMTVTAPPFHAVDLTGVGEAALVMWLANLLLRPVLSRRSPSQRAASDCV